MSLNIFSKNWDSRINQPIFFRNGRRVNLETGYNIAVRYEFIKNDSRMAEWFSKNCKIQVDESPFFIANDIDQPSHRLVVHCSQYIYPNSIGGGEVSINNDSTKLEEFGFEINKQENGAYQFIKTKDSFAKYSDGVIRRWQGKEDFILMPWFRVMRGAA